MYKSLTSVLILLAIAISFFGFRSTVDAPPELKIPKKVNAIIQDKCYGCHSPEGRSDKAKDKLMWDDLTGLSMSDQAMKLSAISKVLDEGTMPPAKMLERMPEKKLTDKEMKVMSKWAAKMGKRVSP